VFPARDEQALQAKNGQIQRYLLIPEAALLVEEERLLLFGDARVRQFIEQSLDLYQQLGCPQITDYRITLKAREAVLCIGDRRFLLPVAGQAT
jgi:hypothetical protein